MFIFKTNLSSGTVQIWFFLNASILKNNYLCFVYGQFLRHRRFVFICVIISRTNTQAGGISAVTHVQYFRVNLFLR